LRLIDVAVGGAVGALLRYALSNVAYRVLNAVFPWGTAMVNLSWAMQSASSRIVPPGPGRSDTSLTYFPQRGNRHGV
jgi:hypothetical protein